MVNLLGFADIIGIERAAFAQHGAPGERSIHRGTLPRQDNRNVAEESHFFLYN
jgi:hypothetical protein